MSSKVRQLKLNINVCISPSKSPLDIRLSAMDWLGVDPTLPPVADKISASYKTYEEQQTMARATALAEKYDAWAFDEFTLAYFPSTEGAYAYAEDLSCFFQPENVYPGHASIVNGIPVDDEWLRVYTKACFMAGKMQDGSRRMRFVTSTIAMQRRDSRNGLQRGKGKEQPLRSPTKAVRRL